ncbi:MAG: ligand-binding sensor domain-containing protein [Bryobacteraceae bacterium]
MSRRRSQQRRKYETSARKGVRLTRRRITSLARNTIRTGWATPLLPAAVLPLLILCAMPSACTGKDRRSGRNLNALAANPLTVPGSLQARIRFQHLTSADGLSQDNVFAILQDHKGFMWFATQGGLNHYDGAVITQYRHDPRNANSPSGDFITDVLEDKHGYIWFSSPGLNRFDPKTGKFTRYRPANLPETKNDPFFISRIHQDRHGFLWLATHGRILYRFDTARESFTEFDIGNDLPNEHQIVATSIQQDESGIIWIGTWRGLVRIDPDTANVRFHKRWSSGDPSVEAVYALAFDADGALFVSYGKLLSRFDPRSQTFTHDWPWADPGQALLLDPSGLLWSATRTGLKLFDPGTGMLRGALVHDPADRYSLRTNEVTSFRHDREGNLWVGTKGGGVSRFSQESLRFGAWRKGPGGVGTLSESNVRAIHVDRAGFVWLGTYGSGLNRFEPGSGKFQYYRHDPKDPRSLSRDVIFSVYEDRQGTLWAGTSAGLTRFDRETGAFRHFESTAQSPRFYTMFEDRRGRFWLGADTTFDRRTGRFTEPTDEVDIKGYISVHEDREGSIWSSASIGIRKLDTSGVSREIPLSRSDDLSRPPVVQVNFIHEDSEGTLWLATETGLVQFDPKTEQYTDYTTNEGLPDNIVQCILPDDAGNLWISTGKGISKFNPKDKSFFNYSESDGLQGQFFNRKACFRDQSGWMYFGGLNGFNRFHPKQILSDSASPPVVITKLQIHGTTVPVVAGSVLPRPVWDMTGLALAHHQNGLSLEFAALSYANPSRIRYRFRLDGLENRWMTVDAQQRSARYTGLRPGEYVFRVQASTNGGVNWGEQGVSLALNVAPPWWNTIWTRSAAVLAFMGLIFGTHKLRVNALQKRQVLLERVVDRRTAQLVEARDQAQAANQRAEEATAMKSMFLANMSHEIRTPMNAVIGMAYLALKTPLNEKQRDYVNKIHNAGTLLLGVINDILDFSKIEAGKLDIEAVEFRLDDVIASATSITAQKAQEKGLELLAEIPDSVPPDLVGDPLRLSQIITNLINNAVKFTEKGEIHVKAELLEHMGAKAKLRFSVKDTGIGMTQDQAKRLFQPFSQADMSTTRKHGGTGLGLTICKRLVELMAGEIWLESEPGAGKHVSIHRVGRRRLRRHAQKDRPGAASKHFCARCGR